MDWADAAYSFVAKSRARPSSSQHHPRLLWPRLDDVSVTETVATGANCKDDGWRTMVDRRHHFKNQGACVSFYAKSGATPIGNFVGLAPTGPHSAARVTSHHHGPRLLQQAGAVSYSSAVHVEATSQITHYGQGKSPLEAGSHSTGHDLRASGRAANRLELPVTIVSLLHRHPATARGGAGNRDSGNGAATGGA